MARDVVILGGARTPMVDYVGAFKDVSALELGAHAARAALERTGVSAAWIDHVVMGNVLQSSGDAIYGARHVGLKAGVPVEVPALIRGARSGFRLGEGTLEDSLMVALLDTHCGLYMAQTSDNLARQRGIGRDAMDEYALRSQKAAAAAAERGVFRDEIAPVVVGQGRKTVRVEADDHLRPETTLDGLAALRPAFGKDGLVTAGNASGIVDGAAALVVASREEAERRGKRPLARIVSWGMAGVPPEIMGIGPVPSTRKALEAAGLSVRDLDLVEVNEAFAGQYLAVEKELGLDRERTTQWRRDRPWSSAGRHRHPPAPDPRHRAAAAEGPVRPGHRLHRRRPGHRCDYCERRVNPATRIEQRGAGSHPFETPLAPPK
jgi:acetyl-CoA acetyltransferase